MMNDQFCIDYISLSAKIIFWQYWSWKKLIFVAAVNFIIILLETISKLQKFDIHFQNSIVLPGRNVISCHESEIGLCIGKESFSRLKVLLQFLMNRTQQKN